MGVRSVWSHVRGGGGRRGRRPVAIPATFHKETFRVCGPPYQLMDSHTLVVLVRRRRVSAGLEPWVHQRPTGCSSTAAMARSSWSAGWLLLRNPLRCATFGPCKLMQCRSQIIGRILGLVELRPTPVQGSDGREMKTFFGVGPFRGDAPVATCISFFFFLPFTSGSPRRCGTAAAPA